MNFYKKCTARSITAVVVLLGSALFNSNAYAIPVQNGLFSLVGDSSGVAPNVTIAQGSYTTTGIVNTAGYTDNDAVVYSTVTLSAFTLNDVTPGGLLADFVLADFTPSGLIAVLNGSNEIIGFTGSSPFAGTATNSGITVTLLGPNFPTVFGGVSGVTFTATPVTVGGAPTSISGNQVIPEPSAIALLGAGMLAFGFVRRKSSLT